MHIVPNTLTHERLVVFVDYANALHALRRVGQQIDLVALRDYLAEGRHLVEAFVYAATHPQPGRQQADRGSLDRLHQHGFLVRSKPGQLTPDGHLTGDLSLEMALDAQEFVARTRPDIVVLVTGDGALAPLARRLRLQGIRVEVASTPGAISPELRAMANGFVNLARVGRRVDNLPLPDLELEDEAPAAPDAAPQEVAADPLLD